MFRSLIQQICAGVLLAVSFPSFASQILVGPEFVVNRSGQSDLVLLHVGEEETYSDGHIPGAVFVNTHAHLSDPASHHGDAMILEMPALADLQERLAGWGVSNDSTIVVYWSDGDITNATRALYTLDWAGLGENSYLLDGGLEGWTAAGHKLTSATTETRRGSLSLRSRDELIVDADWVQQNVERSDVAVLDGRSRAYFDGVQRSRGKSGHIPGAGSAPWTELVDHRLKFRDPDALREVFRAAGVGEGDTVVAYCHIGQYATAVLFAARLLGHEVKLYDGAFQDWATRDLPVTTEG